MLPTSSPVPPRPPHFTESEAGQPEVHQTPSTRVEPRSDGAGAPVGGIEEDDECPELGTPLRHSRRASAQLASNWLQGGVTHSRRPSDDAPLSFEDFQRFSQFRSGPTAMTQRPRWESRTAMSDRDSDSGSAGSTPPQSSRFPLAHRRYSQSSDDSLGSADAADASIAASTVQEPCLSRVSTTAESEPEQTAANSKANGSAVAQPTGSSQSVPVEHASVVPCVMQAIFGAGIYGFNSAIIAGLSEPLIHDVFFASSSSGFQASMMGLLTASILIGAFIGTITSLPFSNRYGRRVSLMVCGVIAVAACVGLAFVPTFAGLVAVRALLGVSVGMTTTICPLYTAECAPVSKRGMAGTAYQVSMVLTILLAEIVNYVFNPSNARHIPEWTWRVQLALGGVFGAALVLTAIALPESHVWIVHRERQKEKQRRRYEAVRSTSASPAESLAATTPSAASASVVAATTPASKPAAASKGWRGLLHTSSIRWLALAVLLAAGNQLTGVNAIIYYAPKIFSAAGYESLSLVLTIAVVGTWNFLCALLSIPMIRAMSRRTMMLIGLSIILVGLTLITVAFSFFSNARAIPSILAIVLFILGYEIGPGPLFYILAAEAFPTSILHAGLSLANQLAWVFNILITFLFPLLTDAIGGGGTFGLFLLACIITIVGYFFLLPHDTDQHVLVPSESPITILAEDEADAGEDPAVTKAPVGDDDRSFRVELASKATDADQRHGKCDELQLDMSRADSEKHP